MGYEIHIERENKITLEEWKRYVEFESTDLKFANSLKGISPDSFQSIELSIPDLVVWTNSDLEVPFTFYKPMGWITVNRPSTSVIKKLKEIASSLNAKVVGEEGEEY